MTKFGISKGHKCQNLIFKKGISDKVWYFKKLKVTKLGISIGCK